MNKVDIHKYIDDEGYSPAPCPNCGSRVDITNSRDCSVLSSYAQCENDSCGGTYFTTESQAFGELTMDMLGVTDFEIVAIKYYNWASSDKEIKGYRCDGEWD